MKTAMKRMMTLVAGLSLLFSTFAGAANAAMIGTQSAVAMEQRARHVAEIQDWLARDSVKQQLTAMGVEPADAAERVAAMTAEELHTVHARINELPAGAGVVEVVGIVFIVFIILEVLGVTNVFTSF